MQRFIKVIRSKEMKHILLHYLDYFTSIDHMFFLPDAGLNNISIENKYKIQIVNALR